MKAWMIVLAVTLILWGINLLFIPGFPNINLVIAVGALVSGVLMLLNR
jgi:hypothetical protein